MKPIINTGRVKALIDALFALRLETESVPKPLTTPRLVVNRASAEPGGQAHAVRLANPTAGEPPQT